MSEKVVLEHDDLRRTLKRIAHEIAEKNPDSTGLAIVGIHTRGAVLARRLHTLLSELTDSELPIGDLDISFYRDDVGAKAPDTQPVVHASHIDFDLSERTVVLVDDVLFTGRTVRAAIDALFDYGRPRRVQLAVLCDRGHRELPIRPDYVGKNLPTAREERVNVSLEESDGARPGDDLRAARCGGARVKHLLAIEELSRDEIEAILDRAESFAEVGRRDIKKVPTLRGRTVVTLFYESSTRTSSSFELAAKRLSADLVSVKAAGSSVDKGESLKDTVATLSAYDPAAIVIRHPYAGAAQMVAEWTAAAVVNAGDGKHEHPSQALLDVYTLRRRLGSLDGQADLDRRRRPPQPRRPLQPDRLPADGGRGHRLRPADPDPARDRGARLRGLPLAGPARRGRRRLRAADAAGADERELRPLAARVRGDLPGRHPPAQPAPAADAPGPGQPRRRALRRGDRLAAVADRRAGRGRPGRADGDPLRAAGRQRAPGAAGRRRRRAQPTPIGQPA